MLLFLQRSKKPQFIPQSSWQLHSHVQRKEDSSTVFKTCKEPQKIIPWGIYKMRTKGRINQWGNQSGPSASFSCAFHLPRTVQKSECVTNTYTDHTYIPFHYLDTHTHIHKYIISFTHRTISGIQVKCIFIITHTVYKHTKRHQYGALTSPTVLVTSAFT